MAITRIVKIDSRATFNGQFDRATDSPRAIQIDTPEGPEITFISVGAAKFTVSRADLLEALGLRENINIPSRPPFYGGGSLSTPKGSGETLCIN